MLIIGEKEVMNHRQLISCKSSGKVAQNSGSVRRKERKMAVVTLISWRVTDQRFPSTLRATCLRESLIHLIVDVTPRLHYQTQGETNLTQN